MTAKYAFMQDTENAQPHRFGLRRMSSWLGVGVGVLHVADPAAVGGPRAATS